VSLAAQSARIAAAITIDNFYRINRNNQFHPDKVLR